MTNKYKKKLIEVAIPLEAINEASIKEKNNPFLKGHPRSLHQWWARRPLPACRAILFAQLVDDPSSYVDELLSDENLRKAAELELGERLTKRDRDKAEGRAIPANEKPVSLEDVAIDLERQRLFRIIEELIQWENGTSEEVLDRAKKEIRRSCGDNLPPVCDPFSGGGAIPLEAQRLGLRANASDLNPVAVLIGKAMIEIPPKFEGKSPVHPGAQDRNHYRNCEGLAEDIRFYGRWMQERAFERIGHLYPRVDLPRRLGGGKADVIAWIWARTVPSPDPAFADVQVPIASSFLLSSKAGKEIWIEPTVDKSAKSITYRIRSDGTDAEIKSAKQGTKAARGANFTCLLSGTAITPNYVKSCGSDGQMGQQLLAIVAQGPNGRLYLDPTEDQEHVAQGVVPEWQPETPLPGDLRAFWTPPYGLRTFGDLFTSRQLVALDTLCHLLKEARGEVERSALRAGYRSDPTPLREGGTGAKAYAEAVSVYLAFAIDKAADYGNSICGWNSTNQNVRQLFARQAIPMSWDFVEANPFGRLSGIGGIAEGVSAGLEYVVPKTAAYSIQADAASVSFNSGGVVVSTDPPYYDNIGYADLSDFFYVWLRRNLVDVFPEIMGTISVPKSEELVATPYRHGGKSEAEDFFLRGMTDAIANIVRQSSREFPAAVYYAFKQSEIEQEGLASTGWATFLQAVISAGYAIVGTWPVRTERAARTVASGTNALANSVVLVCRIKEDSAEVITRAEFIRALKRELPPAIAELQAANIAPADMPQSAIGPGMGVFSRYKAVLEADDSPMSVKTALQLINRELDEFLSDVQGEFDADTRFAITWFEQHGLDKGEYGAADNLARARGIAVESVKHAGIVESAAGKVRILKREELLNDWDPTTDTHLTVWECCQHLIHKLETEGEYEAAVLLKKIGPDKADAVKDLAYCLYDICSNKRKDAKEATSYNALIAVWTELTRQAAAIHETDLGGDRQTAMNF